MTTTTEPPVVDPFNARVRVAAGVEWVDQRLPGALDDIDPAGLDMSNQGYCVLAAAVGGYYSDGLALLDLSQGQAEALGFDATTAAVDEEYAALRDAWCEVLRTRRGA